MFRLDRREESLPILSCSSVLQHATIPFPPGWSEEFIGVPIVNAQTETEPRINDLGVLRNVEAMFRVPIRLIWCDLSSENSCQSLYYAVYFSL